MNIFLKTGTANDFKIYFQTKCDPRLHSYLGALTCNSIDFEPSGIDAMTSACAAAVLVNP